jgi:hypothetical protein
MAIHYDNLILLPVKCFIRLVGETTLKGVFHVTVKKHS